MKIFNVKTYGLEESLVRSGYPKSTLINEDLQGLIDQYGVDVGIQRGKKLGNTKAGEGHDKFLRGIIVQFDMVAPRYFWQEWDTYGHADNLSSQSTMHCISQFDVKSMCNDAVDQRIIDILNEYIETYQDEPTKENLRRVKSNIPEGLELGRGISTNYAQIKTMYFQRKNHRLPEWSVDFCGFVERLPYFNELCLGGKL